MNQIKYVLVLTVALLIGVGINAVYGGVRLQVIHNAADPAASEVDVYLNDGLLLDNFAFRAATPFIDAPSNVALTIGIAPGNSSSAADVIKNFTVTLEEGGTYVAVANGVLNAADFAQNPDGKSTGFTLFVKAQARESASVSGNVDFAVLHGSSDAPTVDVSARGVAQLVNDAAYGDFTDYLSVPAADYTLDITDATGSTVVVTYSAPLSGLANGAAIVFASGFFTPAANQNGAGFGVFAALPDGNVIELPAVTTARLQVIHNAADPAAEKVDIYLNGARLLNNFAFRTATPFIHAPANQEIEIGVAPRNSQSVADAIATFKVNLLAGEKYIVVANGVLDPAGFAPNPDGAGSGFNLFVKQFARDRGTDKYVDFIVFHGVTDAPAVDVAVYQGDQLVNDLGYGDFSEYISVLSRKYLITLRLSEDNSLFGAYDVDLRGLRGASAVVLASGFVSKDANQGGATFELIGVLADGQVVFFPDPVITGVESEFTVGTPSSFELSQNYPNPFNPKTMISFAIPKDDIVTLRVFNALGQEVAVLINQQELKAGRYSVDFDASNLYSGVYFYRFDTNGFQAIRKMTYLK